MCVHARLWEWYVCVCVLARVWKIARAVAEWCGHVCWNLPFCSTCPIQIPSYSANRPSESSAMKKIIAKKHLFWPNLIYAYMNRGVHVDLEDTHAGVNKYLSAAYKRAATCLHRWIDVFMHVNTYENKSITTRIAQVCWICVFSKTFASSSQNSGKNCCDESISTFRGNSANSAVSFWFVRSFSQVYCRKELTPGP